MATTVFLGQPNQKIKEFIKNKYEENNLKLVSINNITSTYDPSIPSINYNLVYRDGYNYKVKQPYCNDSNISAFDSVIAVEGNSITSIGNIAFCECTNLKSINCPNVLSIGEIAFNYCENLSSINCPNV